MNTLPLTAYSMEHSPNHSKHYSLLVIMTALHFVAMYFLMYAMVDSFGNIYNSYNQLYMAGIMTAPMVILEVILMKTMYSNKRRNIWIVGFSVLLFISFFFFIRQQTAIDDEQFLRSMIPHHAGAILMCEKASIRDQEIRRLCQGILSSQQSEIEQMKGILERLK